MGYSKILMPFYEGISKLGSKIPNNEFKAFTKNNHIWDLYALPFNLDSEKNLKKKISEILEVSQEYMRETRNIVTEGIFVSVNLKGKAYLGMKEDPFRVARIDHYESIKAGDDLSEIIEKASGIDDFR